MIIDVDDRIDFKSLNALVRKAADEEIVLNGVMGQRYIAAGISDKKIVINGTPGNALAAFLDGGSVFVYGNAQDATGDTMNGGTVVVYGNSGDATGYAMRGGKIYVRGNIGYRAGIHAKAYKDFRPVIVAGGRAGSFLGEYQAGGTIVVLGLNTDGLPIINNFCGTGMHGGKIYLRCRALPHRISDGVTAEKICGASDVELTEIMKDYCGYFSELNLESLLNSDWLLLTPKNAGESRYIYADN